MTRAEEAALKAYPQKEKMNKKGTGIYDPNFQRRDAYQKGYEQAEKDTITRIREYVKQWMPENPEGDEHISGERVAFRSVLVLLKEMQESMEK